MSWIITGLDNQSFGNLTQQLSSGWSYWLSCVWVSWISFIDIRIQDAVVLTIDLNLQVELCMQDWEQADDTSNRILTSTTDGNTIEATKFKVLQLICRRGQVYTLTHWGHRKQWHDCSTAILTPNYFGVFKSVKQRAILELKFRHLATT